MFIDVSLPGGATPATGAAGISGSSSPDERNVDGDELLELIRRAQTGDLRAQSDLIRRYEARLLGLVRPIVRNKETAKDVVQAVSLKLVRRLPGLRDPRVLESWLFTLARNAAVDEIRRACCRPAVCESEWSRIETGEAAPEDRSQELIEAVQVVTRNWSRLNRRLLNRIIEGESYHHVAEREGLTVGAVKLRLHRLRWDLRESVGAVLGDAPRRTARLRVAAS